MRTVQRRKEESMRVIAGEARRLPLVSPSGKGTRPTTDRIKETLFNIIQNDVLGCRFLDLFSGSGAIGIEAISRGAKNAVFVEMAREPLVCIQKNLEKTRFLSRSIVLPMEVSMGIKKLGRQGEQFDIVFIDPPYDKGLEQKTLGLLFESGIVHAGTLVITETSIMKELDFIDEDIYDVEQVKNYKSNRHVFLRVKI